MPTVLVVEDDVLIAIDLESLLQSAGCTVVGPVPTESAALQLIDSETVDFALIDITLGNGKAFGVADRLAHSDIPFAFLTGHSRDVLPKAHEHRPVIAKPYDPQSLVEEVLALARD